MYRAMQVLRIVGTLCLLTCATCTVRVYQPADCLDIESDTFTPPASSNFMIEFEAKHDTVVQPNSYLSLRLYPFPPASLGHTWQSAGTTRPPFGVALEHEVLRQQLNNGTYRFSAETWASLNVTDLHVYSFVEIQGHFFTPVVSDDDLNAYYQASDQWREFFSARKPFFGIHDVNFDTEATAFVLTGRCFVVPLDNTPDLTYSATFTPTRTVDIALDGFFNTVYRWGTGMPRLQIRMHQSPLSDAYMTALMAVDTDANISQQSQTMQYLTENEYLPVISPQWQQCYLSPTWHPAVSAQEGNITYLASNLTFTMSNATICREQACPATAPDRPRVVCSTAADNRFVCTQSLLCRAENICVDGTYRNDEDNCTQVPMGYYSVQGAGVHPYPVNNPTFHLSFRYTYYTNSEVMKQYQSAILRLDPVGTDGRVWRVELFLEGAQLQRGAEAVVADWRSVIAPVGSTLTWEYATFTLHGGGMARDMERLVLTLTSHAAVGRSTRPYSMAVFPRGECLDASNDMIPPMQHGFYADIGPVTETRLDRDGMTLFYNAASKNDSDISGVNAEIWQSHLSTKANGATVTYDNGTYTVHAPCILYKPHKSSFDVMPVLLDGMYQFLQDSTVDDPLIRLRWNEEGNLIFAMQVDTDANTQKKFALMKDRVENNILDILYPKWRTCSEGAGWRPFLLESRGQALYMVAFFDFNLHGNSKTDCNQSTLFTCPPTAPARDLAVCVVVPTLTSVDSFQCIGSDYSTTCLDTPFCPQGQYFNDNACVDVPADMYGVKRRPLRRRPQGHPVFDALFPLLTTSVNLSSNILDLAPLDGADEPGWVVTVSMNDAMQALGVKAIVEEIRAAVTLADIESDVTYAFARIPLEPIAPDRRRHLLQTEPAIVMEDLSRLLVTATEPIAWTAETPPPPPPVPPVPPRFSSIFAKEDCVDTGTGNFLPTGGVFAAATEGLKRVVQGRVPGFLLPFPDEVTDNLNGVHRATLQEHLSQLYKHVSVTYADQAYLVSSPCLLDGSIEFDPQRDSVMFHAYAREVQRRNAGAPFLRVDLWDPPRLRFAMRRDSLANEAPQVQLMQTVIERYFLAVFYPQWATCFAGMKWSSPDTETGSDTENIVISFIWNDTNTSHPGCAADGAAVCPVGTTQQDTVMCSIQSDSNATDSHTCFTSPSGHMCLPYVRCPDNKVGVNGTCVPIPVGKYSLGGNALRTRPQNNAVFDALFALTTASTDLSSNILDIAPLDDTGPAGWVVTVSMDDVLRARSIEAIVAEIRAAVVENTADVVVTSKFARIPLEATVPGRRRRLLQTEDIKDTSRLLVTVTPAPSTSAPAPETTPAPSTSAPAPETTPAPSTSAAATETTPAPNTSVFIILGISLSVLFLSGFVAAWCCYKARKREPVQPNDSPPLPLSAVYVHVQTRDREEQPLLGP